MSALALSPYQLTGVEFLSSRSHALLADDPGLGKTAQVIAALDQIGAEKTLVICPAVARVNWQREFSMWSKISPSVLFKLKERIPSKSLIVSYDFATENAEKLMAIKWDAVVSDESHFIKESSSRRTKAILGNNGLIHGAKSFWAMSGTPAPNHAAELWPMLFTFGATKLSYDNFVEKFCNTKPTFYGGKYKRKIVGTKREAIPELREILAPFMLRRLKKDVLTELPPKIFEVVTVEAESLVEVARKYLPEETRYEMLKKAQAEKDELMSAIGEIEVILEAMGNSVSALRRFVALQKVKSVAELVAMELEIGLYKKIIIFGYHTDAIRALEKELNARKIRTVKITGSTTDRQTPVDQFQNDESVEVFLGNYVAAGTAITLTASSEVLFFEESWVPGENVQASDRAHRRGQLSVVRVRFASIPDSIDEKVQFTHRRKAQELSEIFD